MISTIVLKINNLYGLLIGIVNFDPKAMWYIVHYEALNKLMAEINSFKNERVVAILDESHNFNDPKSLRTMLFLELCKVLNPIDIVWSFGHTH